MQTLSPAEQERLRFRAVIDQFPSAAAVLEGPEHVYVGASDAYRRFVGGREIIGLPFRTALPELVSQGFLALLDQAYATGEPISGTDVLAEWDDNGDGVVERHFVDFTYQPLREADGCVWGIVIQVLDATARHQANAALLDSEARFRLMFERNPLPMWIFDLATLRFLEVNDAAVLRYGYSRDEFFAMTLRDIRPPEDQARLDQVLPDIRAQRGRIFPGHLHRWKDGTVRNVEVATSETFFEGRPARLALVQDVTERLRAERALQVLAEAGATLSASLDPTATLDSLARLVVPQIADWCFVELATPDGGIEPVAVHHQDSERVRWGRSLMERYPVDPDAPHGTGHVFRTGEPELVPEIPPDMFRMVAQDAEHLRALEEVGFRSHIAVPLRGRNRTLGVLSLVMAESGRRFSSEDLPFVEELARRTAVAVENAQLFESERKAHIEAEAASRTKSQFLATMSHELRTPLNAMIGYSDLLLLGVPEPLGPGAKLQVQRLDRAARHLLSIIEEILTFSRIEVGRETVSPEPVDLPALVGEVVAIVEPLASAKNLHFAAPEELAAVSLVTDPRKLRQILINLLGNAVKFTHVGEIAFEIQHADHAVVFRVRDTGVGIAAEHLEKVFEPFWQVDATPTRNAGGTGLGLAVSRELARMMDGDLVADSLLGAGSVFTLRLPIRFQEATP